MKEKNIEVSVIFPAYNEQGNIIPLIEKTVKAFQDNNYSGEIVMVNDGSTDETQREAEQMAEKYHVLKIVNHQKNKGLTEALMTGFKNIKGDIIIFLCADLQSDPEEDIPKLMEEIKKGNDMVLGWRQGRKEGRMFVSKTYNLLIRLLFGITVHDMNWIKAFRREVVNDISLRSDWHRYIPVIAAHQGYRVSEIKTKWHERQHGKSKFEGKKRILTGLFDLLTVKFQLSFLDRPMFFFGTPGLFLLFICFLIFIYGLLKYIITTFLLGGEYYASKVLYFTFISCLFGGMLLFALGFLAEFLVTIRDDIKNMQEKQDNSQIKNK